MPLAAGTRLGPYEITAPIGAGGMGEVYKARDTRLDRTVAVKVLPPEFAADEQRRQRLEREARAVSALNHPHICTLHDIGNQDGVDYLVLEYIDGKPLAGPMPVEAAVRYAVQIADALDQAHRKGVFHRDLKPANILVTKAGVKLLDFGLAKVARAPLEGDAQTLTKALTTEGSIVGTLQYMAPEQLGGVEADARSDIFAFGALLYEMLTGRRAFDGKNSASVIAAILGLDPPALSTLQPLAPAALERVVATCLAKDPDDRWQTARDLKRELEWAPKAGLEAGVQARTPAPRLWPIAAVVFFVVALGFGWLWWRATGRPVEVVRFQIQPPAGTRFARNQPPMLTRDGKSLAFVASRGGVQHLYVQPLDSLQARALPGTEGAVAAFWSPDGASLAFQSGDKLRRIDLAGGSPRVITDMASSFPGHWSPDGVILFRTTAGGVVPLFRVSAAGGAAAPATEDSKQPGESSHVMPQLLPDGKRFLYFSPSSDPERSRVMLASLESTKGVEVLRNNSNGIFIRVPVGRFQSRGFLLSLRDRTLMAYPFDEGRGVVTGDPLAVSDDVGTMTPFLAGLFSVSTTGVLATMPATTTSEGRLAWFDRSGKPLGELPATAAGDLPALSPDGGKLAVSRHEAGRFPDIWVTDLTRGAISMRLTFSSGYESHPSWSSDGKRITYVGDGRVMEKDASGSGSERPVGELQVRNLFDSSPDGRFLLVRASGDRDLVVQPLSGDRKPIVMARDASEGRFSPDSKFVAYASRESGRWDVYVRPLPPAEGKWLISSGGGAQPTWRRDGQELFYVSSDMKMMAVDVKPGASFQAGIPRPLFQTQMRGSQVAGHHYAVTTDGNRFLLYLEPEDESDRAITVVLNWWAGL